MQTPRIMIGMGATKAGTSWLYRYVHDHPECHVRSVKELHYFDTIEADTREDRLGEIGLKRAGFVDAMGHGDLDEWQRRNHLRQIDDLSDLAGVFARGVADSDGAYRAYLMHGRNAEPVVAELTPSYALLPAHHLKRIVRDFPEAVFVYVMRDPLSRLWSHVRMQARRAGASGQELARKAGRILNRVVNRGLETHIAHRGDYAAALTRFDRAIPSERLHVAFLERLLTAEGLASFCVWLGISRRAADTRSKVHEGVALPLGDRLRADAQRFLAPQYEFVRTRFGDLPEAWSANMTRV